MVDAKKPGWKLSDTVPRSSLFPGLTDDQCWLIAHIQRNMTDTGRWGELMACAVDVCRAHNAELEQLRAGLAALVDALPKCNDDEHSPYETAAYIVDDRDDDATYVCLKCAEHRKTLDTYCTDDWAAPLRAALRLLGRDKETK